MNRDILIKHIKHFMSESKKNPSKFNDDYKERLDLITYYQGFTKDKILKMTEDDIYEYISKLWAMLIWGNKQYVVDKIIDDNGLDEFRKNLAELVWGQQDVEERWNDFRTHMKGMGPATMSEILCKTHPESFILWNRRAYVGLDYIGVDNLPRYDYQHTGKTYKRLCDIGKKISEELQKNGFHDSTLLAVDYFIWDELQVEDNLKQIYKKKPAPPKPEPPEVTEFIHNDVRDKLRDIGQWLGFNAKIEQKVSEGSRVDAIWEATIGNMGRVIYVFEVQTKGNIDSMILNLLKSLNNPAVQGVVAVSDKDQLKIIKKHAQDVKDLRDKLKYWDYEEILKVNESLEFVNTSINNLGLVPQGF